MPRLLPLLLLTSCGLLGMSEADRRALAQYQSNAQTYWEGNRLDQALDQVRRGLEIDPDDYKLHTIRAWCLLRQSRAEPRLLDDAVAAFDELLERRSDDEHSAQARLGYAEAHGLLALRHFEQARDDRESAERVATSAADRAVREADASQHEATAQAEIALAERQLERLVELGDSLLLAHYNLMTTKWWRGDYDGAVQHGQSYLARAKELQDRERAALEQTTVEQYERDLRVRLQALLDDEVRVRGFLANAHYKRGHHELVVQQLDALLAIDPMRYNEYYNRGRSLMALGRADEARRDFEKFVAVTDLPFDSAQVRDALRSLRELK